MQIVRKIFVTYLLLVMTAVGTGTMGRMATAAPAVQTADGRGLPAAPAAPARQSGAPAPLSTAQMTSLKGDGLWGWLKKIWKKHKKKIIKIISTIINIIFESVTSETNEYAQTGNGDVTAYYEGNDETEQVYASQADYDASNVQSSSYVDYGYSYQYSEPTYGGGGGEY